MQGVMFKERKISSLERYQLAENILLVFFYFIFKEVSVSAGYSVKSAFTFLHKVLKI
jgi:hypothetical protein